MADGRHVGKYSKCHNSPTNDWDANWVVTSLRVPDMSAMMRLPWQRPSPSNDALYIQQLWASGDRTREPILIKFSKQTQSRTTTTVTWSNIIILKFKMADGCHVGKYSKCHNSPTKGPTETQVGWSHHITSPTCPSRFGCYGNSRCLATPHWTFCSYGRLQAERVNQFW